MGVAAYADGMESNGLQMPNRRWRFAPPAVAGAAIVAMLLTLSCSPEAEPPPTAVEPTAMTTPQPDTPVTATPTVTTTPQPDTPVTAAPTATTTPQPDTPVTVAPTATTTPQPEEPSPTPPTTTLQTVLDRGELLCGVRAGDGAFSGFEIEFCKAIAAAVLGDADKVTFVTAWDRERFDQLSAGKFDVLMRLSTVTAQRDAGRSIDFAPAIFYEGRSFAVHADSPYRSTADMDGATVCVLADGTAEYILDNHFTDLGIEYVPLSVDVIQWVQDAFVARRCEVWMEYRTFLASRIAQLDNPSQYRVLGQTISMEPLAPAVRQDDSQWRDIVSWVVYGLISAEELGITRDNVAATASNPLNFAVLWLLGVPFGGEVFDPGFGIDPQFIRRAIMAVGNYGEIYERTLAAVGIAREGSLNALYTDGGLLYAPPYRLEWPYWLE